MNDSQGSDESMVPSTERALDGPRRYEPPPSRYGKQVAPGSNGNSSHTEPSQGASGVKTHELPKANILIVDDRADKLLALEAILSSLGQTIVKARSAKMPCDSFYSRILRPFYSMSRCPAWMGSTRCP